MFTNAEEAAYCASRIEHSMALARASVDSCARTSHLGIAEAYGKRLAALTRIDDPSTQDILICRQTINA